MGGGIGVQEIQISCFQFPLIPVPIFLPGFHLFLLFQLQNIMHCCAILFYFCHYPPLATPLFPPSTNLLPPFLPPPHPLHITGTCKKVCFHKRGPKLFELLRQNLIFTVTVWMHDFHADLFTLVVMEIAFSYGM